MRSWGGRVGRDRLPWSMMTASHYTIGDVTSMLIAARVFKPDGSIWETDDVGLWFKAIGKKSFTKLSLTCLSAWGCRSTASRR
jgi:hypothetical protein